MEIQIDTAADQAILSALREGKGRHAAGLLVRYYGNMVFNVCRSLIGQAEQAEDLTQETFRRAFSMLSGIVGQVSPRTWLMSVAQECCGEQAGRVASAASERHPIADPPADAATWRISESLQRRLEMLASAL
jgi:DNA-directed RNA polymerase specialized sigma24 family protein